MSRNEKTVAAEIEAEVVILNIKMYLVDGSLENLFMVINSTQPIHIHK